MLIEPARTTRARCSCSPSKTVAGSSAWPVTAPRIVRQATRKALPRCRHRRSARRPRSDRGRRLGRRDRDAPLPHERPAPLRPPAQLPGRAAGRRRRDLLVQPNVRAGHDGGRRAGDCAARLPASAAGATSLAASSAPQGAPIDDAWKLSVGADLALPEVEGRRSVRVRVINAYLRRLRATAEHDHAVAGAFTAVIGMLERPAHVLRAAIALRVARSPRRFPSPSASKACACANCVSAGCAAAARGRAARRHGGRRLPARQPGSSADWAAAARRHRPALARCGLGRPRVRSRDLAGRGLQSVAAHARFVSRALDALGIERALSWPTTSAGPGASLGQPLSPIGSPARSCLAPARFPDIAGTRSRGSGAPRTPASCSWP